MHHPFPTLASICTFPVVALAVVLAGAAPMAHAQDYVFTTLAGTPGGGGLTNGPVSQAQFNEPLGVARDAQGNFFIADTGNNVIRRLSVAGEVTTFAGVPGTGLFVDASGNQAGARLPLAVAVDGTGNLYTTDLQGHAIWRITSTGVVTLFAGSTISAGSVEGTGSVARFRNPAGLAVDSAGNVFVADRQNHTIRRITSAGVVTTFAGNPGSSGFADGLGNAARFASPYGLALDAAGNLYVSEIGNHTIRKITSTGAVSTLAGSPGDPGSFDGAGTTALFNAPTGLVVDPGGTVYVCDSLNHTIRRITSAGVVTTLAGNASAVAGGYADGTGPAARFSKPNGISRDAAGNLLVLDSVNHLIRRVSLGGVVTTLAGLPASNGAVDAIGDDARFNSPFDVAVDAGGVVYVADRLNHTIRKIAPGGVVTTFAGAAAIQGFADGVGTNARFSRPAGVAVDTAGNLYVADTLNHVIRRITSSGVVTTFAGSAGEPGATNGTGGAARFRQPSDVAVDANGTLYVADTGNELIRRISPAGVVTTLAGSAGEFGFADGTGGAARFNTPSGLAIDSTGTLFVADSASHTIRKVSSTGIVTTLAGTPGIAGTLDGTGGAAMFASPSGIVIDPSGNVLVADSFGHTIRRVTGAGVVTTIAGTALVAGAADGVGSAARFQLPRGLAMDRAGNLYVADSNNNTIRWGSINPPSLSSPPTAAGVVRQAFAYTATFAGTVTGPYEATGLPAGLAFNTTSGVISGTPTVTGNFRLTLRASNAAGTGSGSLSLTISGPPVITTQPRDLTVDVGRSVRLSVVASGFPTPTFQWRRNGVAIAGATAANFAIANVTTADAGEYSVVATNLLGSVTSRNATLTIVSGFPTIGTEPADQTLSEGANATLTVAATGNATLAYQWTKDGTPIAGATASSLSLASVTSAEAGAYAVTVSNAIGTVTSDAATVTVEPASAIANLSIRTGLAAGQTLIVGAVVRDGTKNVLVRAAGPALAAFGLTGLTDPILEVFGSGPLPIAANDDWAANLGPTFTALGAFAFTPGSRDAALLQSLNGAVTFQARGPGAGTVLVEAYDATGGLTARLANLSARSRVGTGSDILIAGFNLSGTSSKQVLIRAIGPGLAAFNVTGTLADPSLQVLNSAGAVVASNNDWSATLAPTFTRVGAFPLTNGSRDAALLVTLPAGASYTVQVSGADGGTGEALIEIYEVF